MSRIAAILAAIVALGLALWFLGTLVVSIGAIPLWIIIVATCVLMTYDFVQSIKDEAGSGASNGQS